MSTASNPWCSKRQSRAYCEARIRAGVLENGTVELLHMAQVADRMEKEKLIHGGVEISFDGKYRYIDFVDLTGQDLTIWGQTQIVRDLNRTRAENGDNIVFEAEDVAIHDFDSDNPRITYCKDGEAHELNCDFIAGLRRLSRRLPGLDPGKPDHHLRADLPLRLARYPGRTTPGVG